MKQSIFVKKYAKAVHDGYAAVFAGAGTSVGAGYLDWKALVKPFASELGLDIDKETDLVRVAQYYINDKGGNRGEINNEILNNFSKFVSETETIDILTRLPIETYWTTNYDQNIENSLKKNNRKVDVKRRQINLASNIRDRDAVIYKMHGDIDLPDEAVISKDDYELYNETHTLFTTALKGDLVSKTFLFIGFSFEDPNLDDILGKIKVLLGKDKREHYCILRKIDKKDFKKQGQKSDEEFTLATLRQQLRIKDLKRYGIETILVDSYDEIPIILAEIENIYLNNTIFISGSISSYTENIWDKQKVDEFCYKLSKKIVKENHKVVSGFGLGIGSSVINGALDEIYTNKYKHINEHLNLYPFPQIEIGQKTMKERWTDNRYNMISDSGICIFIFGNKIEDEKIINANGMIEEFEIAKKLGKIIIPVGKTGNAAEEIFEKMQAEADLYPYLENYWEKLMNEEAPDLISTISEIIQNQQ
jgi:hypothetical protein